jgi:NTP pyrophosphatase (non-canonical NTP hydrolase)
MHKVKSTLHLPKNPTLADLQRYVVDMEKQRGFAKNNEDPLRIALLLGEEVGELFKAIRKRERITVARDSEVSEVAHELADILNFVAAIANRYGVDLETAFREKEEKNKKRMWV